MTTTPSVGSGGQLSPEQLLEKQKAHDLRMASIKFQSAMLESEQAAKNRMAEAIARSSQ